MNSTDTVELTAASLTQPQKRRKPIYPYLYILPGLLFMLLATVIPGLATIYISLTDFSIAHLKDWTFVGLKNYQTILIGASQVEFIRVFGWTLAWTLLSTALAYTLGLFLALLLNNRNLRERDFYRTLLILPWAMPTTITILSWTGLFSSSFGPINRLLGSLGFAAIPWLTDPTWARFTCLAVNLWLSFPFMMAACLGALQSIPDDYYDAGRVDGASSIQIFRHITFPLLRSATLPLLVSGFAMQFANFGVVYLMTNGGPFTNPGSLAGETELLATYMYKLAFGSNTFNYAMAAATSIIIFIIVGSLTLLNSNLTGAFREVD
ncbi:MAG TPA: sugar ABC transporter permease [Anaerolineaceae bacterium]|nr:sugar ABC transporter permease [Anaerolineaceae bacterium]